MHIPLIDVVMADHILTLFTHYCMHVYPLTVPGGPPENFTVDVISSTQIQLMWQPPASGIRNGLVRFYRISVIEVQTNNSYFYTQPSGSLALQIDFRHPFYDYVCSVAAATTEVGPYTSPLTVRTFQDGKPYPSFLTTRFIYFIWLTLVIIMFL